MVSHCALTHCFVHDGETCAAGWMRAEACPNHRGPAVGSLLEVHTLHPRARLAGDRAVGVVAGVERLDDDLVAVVVLQFCGMPRGVYRCHAETRDGLRAWVWTHRLTWWPEDAAGLAAAVLECRIFAMFALERG